MGDGPGKQTLRRTVPDLSGGNAPETPFPVAGVGASAGGFEAASRLLRHLPVDLGMAIVIVQHLDPTHESALPLLLSRVCPMPVNEATEGQRLEPGHVYVIPPNASMILEQGALHLTPREEAQEPRRPVDRFLRSLAQQLGPQAVGVVLSGTGSDGTHGMEAIRSGGGITLAQDASAIYDGMPTSAAAAGCVDFVLSPEAIAQELARISRHPSVRDCSATEVARLPTPGADDAFDAVIRRLAQISGVDFSNYKQATLRRRTQRRMLIRRIESMEDYLELIERDDGEAENLCQEVLINVTSFFRDPAVFDAVRQVVFPAILDGRTAETPIRIWVAGCATGEEVYSLAICLLEALGPRSATIPIKLFGTDVSESVVARARAGRYPESIASVVDSGRLRRFFVKDDNGYVVTKAVRDLCIFARQDATRDPPFSNLDLISCRNVLIYLGAVLQKRILPFFHYALRENGFLVLGTSETTHQMADLFCVVDGQKRIFSRRSVPTRLVFDVTGGGHGATRRSPGEKLSVPVTGEVDLLREADRILLARCAPPGCLIDETFEILQFRGNTGPFLSPAPGTPSNNLRSMAREGLFPDLADAVEQARSEQTAVRKAGLEVIPVQSPLSSQRCYLVLFEETGAAGRESPDHRRRDEPEPEGDLGQRRVVQLQRELASAKDYLRAIVEEREAANEELRAANEELLSSNEELQSTNEELQTAHEELQATNEELLTVNDELQHRNTEAMLLGSDLINLLASIEIPIIMLGRDLRIRRFTPSAGKLLNLIPGDLDRSILDLRPKIDVPDLEALLVEVLETFAVKHREVQDGKGKWHTLGIRPYRSQDNKIDGVVITLNDIDAIKRSAQQIEQARDFAENIVTAVREPLLVLDGLLRVKKHNDAGRRLFAGTVPKKIGAAGAGEAHEVWQVAGLLERLQRLLSQGVAFDDFEVEAILPGAGKRTLCMNARKVHGGDEDPSLILLAIEDVTDRRRAEQGRILLAQRLQETQRLESLGVLAGGIAHDFNNILTAILGYTSVVRAELAPDSGLAPHIRNIEKSTVRAADLAQQMLACSGKGRMLARRIDLSALIRDFESLLRASVNKKALLQFELAPAPPTIIGDVAQLNQLMMNLIINASESLSGGAGTIVVRTGTMRPDREYLAASRLRPEPARDVYAYLEVADDGCGMDEATQARIFDPFFSLKFAGRGLGLATTIGIVRSHNGALSLDSDPGRGSVFRVLFPAVSGPADEIVEPPAVETRWRGSGTVLIVDDEESIRSLLREMLRRLGFEVLEAADGRAGVEAFGAGAGEIDLVLLDLTMPHMDGAETLRELRKLHPQVRVILMSGYPQQQSLEAVTDPGLSGFLRKPFGLHDLTVKLRAAFEGE